MQLGKSIRFNKWTGAIALLAAIAIVLPYAIPREDEEHATIVFIGRTPNDFDSFHAQLLHDLIAKRNSDRPGGLPLRFEAHCADVMQHPDELSRIYQGLATRNDVVAVFDNCWGSELATALAAIRAVPAPIIFLNGDHNQNNFGDRRVARLFVGDASAVVPHLQQLLKTLLPAAPAGGSTVDKQSHPVSARDVWFLGEPSYLINQSFKRALSDAVAPAHLVDLRCRNGAPPEDSEIAIVKSQLASLKDRPNDRKLVVLNCHQDWGKVLLPWIDEQCDNVTVAGHQSITSRESLPFIKKNNQLIILGQSPRAVPDVLYAAYRRQKAAHPRSPDLVDDMLYVRRCFVAVDLIDRAIQEAGHEPGFETNTGAGAGAGAGARMEAGRGHRRMFEAGLVAAVNKVLTDFRGRPVQSSLGRLFFDADGIEAGGTHILLCRKGGVCSYPLQFNSRNELVPNLQFGFQDVKIADVNIASRSFSAAFYFWVRCQNGALQTLLGNDDEVSANVLKLFDFRTSAPCDIHVVSTQTFGSIDQVLFHVSGTFAGQLNGRLFPFDRQRLTLQLRMLKPDDEVRISPELYERAREEIVEGVADGWKIVDQHVTIDNRMTSQILIGFNDSHDTDERQYNQATLTFDMLRQSWNPALLILCPLALLTLASMAVLFIEIKPPGDQEGAPAGHARTELTLVCLLTVVTYLMSYATLAPRPPQPTLADFLVGFTLLIGVGNFVFCAAINERTNSGFWAMVTLRRYRFAATTACCVVFGSWLVVTMGVLLS